MAVIKCKMCGGDIELSTDRTIGTCECCGTTITLPKIDDDQRAALFNRGNGFRRAGEFDKALTVYERIVEEDDTDAEAHWNCVLCRFGIEYVEDPTTYEYIPTCHRASFDSILEDVDYKAALEHSDGITRRQYMKDAAKIAEVQKGILATSQNEEPFDVFISYKETDDNGNRTVDATLAQDIYYRLTEKGYRVFFSRITLEGKPGTEYEPYIFAALNSSKVMVLVGTSAENINSVWVKNEWSRFMALRKKDRSKLLIPCYRDMDPYDLPEQISVLKAYDMGQIGFIQDLIRGIEKVLNDGKPQSSVGTASISQPQTIVQQVVTGGTTVDAQVKRGNMALEDKEWDKANGFFEEALNLNPECAEAYLGELLAREKKSTLNGVAAAFETKYAKLITIRLEACPEDTDHIEKAISENAIEGFLEAETIQALYSFDRGYDAQLPCRRKQMAKQLQELKNDRLLMRARQYATGDIKTELECKFSGLIAALRIVYADKADAESIAKVKAAYAEKIRMADREAKEMHDAAENKYQIAMAKETEKQKLMAEISAVEKERRNLEHQIAEKKQQQSALGLFRIKEKKAIQVQIDNLSATLAEKEEYNNKLAEKKLDYLPACGSIVSFGRYKQTEDEEKIDWIVLAKNRDGKLLLISKKALDRKQYNTMETAATWRMCSMRRWLNGDFYKTAFNAAEQAMIVTTTVTADRNPEYDTDPGSDTQDKVFLLSINEVNKYFASEDKRKCEPTPYAKANGVVAAVYCRWWLRTPGVFGKYALYVDDYGEVDDGGMFVNNSGIGVRPAMWVQY